MITNCTGQEKLYTYQDLSGVFAVHAKTIYRWFHGRPKFKPTHNTVRITESQLHQFLRDKTHK